MSVASKHSCASSTHTSCQPRSRTHNASLCSTPNAPGSSRARLPIIATTGSRSDGVTAMDSIAYIQPTPEEPTNTRAPTDEACLQISNWECSPSATMYSHSSSPSAMSLATACMTPSYGRIGYADVTSTSARRTAWATASVPVINFSTCFTSRPVSWVVIAPPLLTLGPGVGVEEVLVGYPPALYLLVTPLVVGFLVLLPHGEDVLVALLDKLEVIDHHDAVLDRADVGADAAAGAVFVVDGVQGVGADLEALVGAVDPALAALDTRVEVDHRPHGTIRGGLVVRVALARLYGLDDDGVAHLVPPGQLDRLVVVLFALACLDLVNLDLVVAVL